VNGTGRQRRRPRLERTKSRARGRVPPDDVETRARLLAVATTLFTDQGFKQVTVRDICREARANVAAVNYYFGGKQGLYTQVVRAGVAVMRETEEMAERAAEGLPPEERLRAYVRAFLGRVIHGRPSWIHKLVTREMNDPTPALEIIVEQAIQPRIEYLGALLAELLAAPRDDERVWHSMASIWGQWLVHIPNEGRDRIWPRRREPADIERLVDHITEFSLGGIRAIARSKPQRRG